MDDDVIPQFLTESWEGLSRFDAAILALEQEPENHEPLAEIFRTIHSLKGACGAIGLKGIGRAAHVVENALGKLRDGSLAVNSSSIAFLLTGIECIKDLLDGLEATGEEIEGDLTGLMQQFDRLVGQGTISAAEVPLPDAVEPSLTTKPERAAPVEINVPGSGLFARVNVDLLDRFTHLVAELALTRNELRLLVPRDDESPCAGPIARLDRITADLEVLTQKSRKQPIGNAWSKLPRLVRELSCITGKPMELEMHGAETELDRTLLTAIRNALTHLVRNAADHGIENGAVRQALGKPASGRVAISAVQEGDAVILCVEDDGAGINRQRVIQRALELGLIAEEDAIQLPDTDLVRLIMQPGFSTVERITSISGRGVGLDVVQTEIAKIGGDIEVSSEPGRGTNVRTRIPLARTAAAETASDTSQTQPHALPLDSSEKREETPSGTTAPRALVIDDSRFFRQLFRAALESEGYRITLVDAAEQAIELLDRNTRFDVILCDIEMPGMDGCQFAEWCRNLPELHDVPLVAITSLDAETHGERILSAGFDRLLTKFNPQQLRETLAGIVPQPNWPDARISA